MFLSLFLNIIIISIYSLKLDEKFLHFLMSGTFPLLSVSVGSGGGEAQYSTVQKAHGCS